MPDQTGAQPEHAGPRQRRQHLAGEGVGGWESGPLQGRDQLTSAADVGLERGMPLDPRRQRRRRRADIAHRVLAGGPVVGAMVPVVPAVDRPQLERPAGRQTLDQPGIGHPLAEFGEQGDKGGIEWLGHGRCLTE